jgi:hypothetical protein
VCGGVCVCVCVGWGVGGGGILAGGLGCSSAEKRAFL